MVLSLQTLAGEEAVKRLHVLLHVNEDQEEEVVAELHQHKWFGWVLLGRAITNFTPKIVFCRIQICAELEELDAECN
eukprot:1160573-Pelagomonas_calceolata.AAC.25